MKQGQLSFSRLAVLVVLLIMLSAAAGWFLANGQHGLLPLVAMLLLFVVWKLVGVYLKFIKNLNFIFHAVRNNDYSFRFATRGSNSGFSVVNYSLNSIKEVLDDAKLKVAEKERYFEAVIECANIGIMIVHENGAVARNNKKALALLGVPMLSHINRLRPLSEELADTMFAIPPGEQRIVRFSTEASDVCLLLNCSLMNHDGHSLRVITIENINRELDIQEVLSWEKLTRILTHEIMNSLAPVTSISNTLLHCNNDDVTLQQGLETIHSTSDRLMRFIDSFRTVTRIPLPQKQAFYLLGLVKETVALMNFGQVKLNVSVQPADTIIYADRDQISQVFLNILKNAVEACSAMGSEGCIEIRSHIAPDERVHIEIGNNGGVVPSEVAENLFTPFYTTKQGGSGIGLAVSKQIIRLHGGSLQLAHNSDESVVFLIVLD